MNYPTNGKTCLLHIGLHKTGTTAIQQFFHKNRTTLLDYGVNYLHAPCAISNHSVPFYSLYGDEPLSYYPHEKKGIDTIEKLNKYNDTAKKELECCFEKNTSPLMVISGESISRIIDANNTQRLKNDLYTYFDKVFVLVYIREWVPYVSSCVSQLVRTRPFNISQAMHLAIDSIKKLPKTLLNFADAFGNDAILCAKYDPKEFPNNDIVLDFLQRIHVHIHSSRLFFDSRLNASVSAETIRILSLINKEYLLFLDAKSCRNSMRILSAIKGMLHDIGHSRFAPSQTETDEILNSITEEVTFFKDKYGIVFEKSRNNTAVNSIKACEKEVGFAILELLTEKVNIESQLIHIESILQTISNNKELPISYYNSLIQLLSLLHIDIKDIGYFQKCKEISAKALRHSNHGCHELHMQASQIYDNLNEPEMAIQEVRAAITLDSENHNYHHHLGNLLKNLGDMDGAVAAQEKAIALNPFLPGPYVQLSYLYSQLGKLEQAIQQMQNAITLKVDNPHFHHQLGILLRKNGDLEGAMKSHLKSIALDPSFPGPHVQLSHIYKQLGDVEQAIQKIQDAIVLNNDNPNSHHHLGNLLRFKGDIEGAIMAQQNAIALDPSMPSPHAQLSHLYNQLGNGELAIQKIRDAIALQGDNAQYFQHLGNLLKKTGDEEGATEARRKANQLKARQQNQ